MQESAAYLIIIHTLHIAASLFSADKEMFKKDIALQSRIRQLRWITSHHLEAIFDSSNPV